jgi:hypothetical protein
LSLSIDVDPDELLLGYYELGPTAVPGIWAVGWEFATSGGSEAKI